MMHLAVRNKLNISYGKKIDPLLDCVVKTASVMDIELNELRV
jgi:hypothetical protein